MMLRLYREQYIVKNVEGNSHYPSVHSQVLRKINLKNSSQDSVFGSIFEPGLPKYIAQFVKKIYKKSWLMYDNFLVIQIIFFNKEWYYLICVCKHETYIKINTKTMWLTLKFCWKMSITNLYPSEWKSKTCHVWS